MDSSEFDPYRSPQTVDAPIQPGSVLERAVGPYRTAATLVAILTFALLAHIVLDVAAIGSSYLQIRLIDNVAANGGVTQEEADANDLRETAIALGQLGLILLTAALFFAWVHRANLNARALGARDMRFTAGWCIGWWFVPFANLVRPYQAVREVWDASQPRTLANSPTDWKMDATGGAIVACWWAMWILSGIVGRVSSRMAREDSLAALRNATWADLVGSVIGVPLALLAIAVVRGVHNRQELKLELSTKPADHQAGSLAF